MTIVIPTKIYPASNDGRVILKNDFATSEDFGDHASNQTKIFPHCTGIPCMTQLQIKHSDAYNHEAGDDDDDSQR